MNTTNVRPRNMYYDFLIAMEAVILFALWFLLLGDWRTALLGAVLSFCVLGWGLRLWFQRHYRRGVQRMYQKDYAAAAGHFQESWDYYKSKPWIDKYCFLTMFSSSAIPYEEMSMNNLALCLLHQKKDKKALEIYKKLREKNPDYPYIDRSINEIEYHLDHKK